MRLLIPLLSTEKPYPAKDYSIKPHLRREAVALAVSTIEEKRDRDKADPKMSEYSDTTDWTCEWLTEILIQGAYIREYHSWEREAKSFLNGQSYLNGESEALKWKVGREGFVALIRESLREFSAAVDERTLATIDIMRKRVNEMKHAPAFSDSNLVSKGDYDVAAQAMADLWSRLMNQRIYAPMEWNEHVDKYFSEIP